MARHAQLNNNDHRDLRIDTGHGAALGDAVAFAPTFPGEFRNIQACYPIVFRKDERGALQPVALFGFEEGQNLFLDGARWDAAYLPLAIERQPFLIGRDGEALSVHIDLDHPRACGDGGQPLFREHGGSTEYLDRISSILQALHDGLAGVPAFVDALLQHGLLESFVFDVELADGRHNRLAGFYAIDEDRLRKLDAGALDALHRPGYLEAAYMAVASVARLRDLVERMNRGHAAGG